MPEEKKETNYIPESEKSISQKLEDQFGEVQNFHDLIDEKKEELLAEKKISEEQSKAISAFIVAKSDDLFTKYIDGERSQELLDSFLKYHGELEVYLGGFLKTGELGDLPEIKDPELSEQKDHDESMIGERLEGEFSEIFDSNEFKNGIVEIFKNGKGQINKSDRGKIENFLINLKDRIDDLIKRENGKIMEWNPKELRRKVVNYCLENYYGLVKDQNFDDKKDDGFRRLILKVLKTKERIKKAEKETEVVVEETVSPEEKPAEPIVETVPELEEVVPETSPTISETETILETRPEVLLETVPGEGKDVLEVKNEKISKNYNDLRKDLDARDESGNKIIKTREQLMAYLATLHSVRREKTTGNGKVVSAGTVFFPAYATNKVLPVLEGKMNFNEIDIDPLRDKLKEIIAEEGKKAEPETSPEITQEEVVPDEERLKKEKMYKNFIETFVRDAAEYRKIIESGKFVKVTDNVLRKKVEDYVNQGIKGFGKHSNEDSKFIIESVINKVFSN
jgi:hypothetical protein